MHIEIKTPKALDSHTKTVFQSKPTLDETIEDIFKELPEVPRNKLMRLLWIYHNSLINQIKKNSNL